MYMRFGKRLRALSPGQNGFKSRAELRDLLTKNDLNEHTIDLICGTEEDDKYSDEETTIRAQFRLNGYSFAVVSDFFQAPLYLVAWRDDKVVAYVHGMIADLSEALMAPDFIGVADSESAELFDLACVFDLWWKRIILDTLGVVYNKTDPGDVLDIWFGEEDHELRLDRKLKQTIIERIEPEVAIDVTEWASILMLDDVYVVPKERGNHLLTLILRVLESVHNDVVGFVVNATPYNVENGWLAIKIEDRVREEVEQRRNAELCAHYHFTIDPTYPEYAEDCSGCVGPFAIEMKGWVKKLIVRATLDALRQLD